MMVKMIPWALGLIFLRQAQAAGQSSLYPSIDSVGLAKAFNVSLGCLEALNQTVSCDGTLLGMAGSVDNYLWDRDNITSLCTSDCVSTVSAWYDNVLGACSAEYINVRGRQVPPSTIPGRLVDGMNIACLTPTTDVSTLRGVQGVEITSTETLLSNSTVTDNSTVSTATGAAVTAAAAKRDLNEALRSVVESRDAGDTMDKRDSGGSGYCLVDSYDWVGSDIIRPDCPDGSTLPQCLDPTDVPEENQRIANLYSDDVLCSQCFIKMFYLRVSSPYLPDLDYSDYLLKQYLDIVDVCKANMPDLLVRMLPQYENVQGTWDGMPEHNGTDPRGSVACNQTLYMSDLKSLQFADENAPGPIICDALSAKYNVTTGDLNLAFGAYYCTPDTGFQSVCLPASCPIMAISNTTCELVAATLSTPTNTITVTQLLSWNPNLQGLCDDLFDQYVCVGAPGGSYIPPPASNTTSNDGNQQRGGGSPSGGVRGGGRNATVVRVGGPAPSPTQDGIDPQCTEYVRAEAGDGCEALATLWRIPLLKFYGWNSVLGKGGENCRTKLLAEYYYCIDVFRNPTASAVPTTTQGGAPGPTQSGIVSNCNKYAISIPDKGCYDFAVAEGITPQQLYTWNTILGANGENCSTKWLAQEYYCVGVSSSSSSPAPTTTQGGAPGPTQSGIVSNCNKYAISIPDKGCYDFAVAEGITPQQLYTWNTILGANGENCSTKWLAQEYYCVGVSSSSSSPAPTTTQGGSGPGPTQSGIVSNCNKYAMSIPDKGCYDFAVAEGITPQQLYTWNTILGPNGENCGTKLLAQEYYCVGIGAPGPTQAGIASNCNKYAESIPDKGCYDFAVAEGITPQQLYAWNPVLGTDGSSCGTKLWAKTFYCVGVSS